MFRENFRGSPLTVKPPPAFQGGLPTGALVPPPRDPKPWRQRNVLITSLVPHQPPAFQLGLAGVGWVGVLESGIPKRNPKKKKSNGKKNG